jgi:hypothetical protein
MTTTTAKRHNNQIVHGRGIDSDTGALGMENGTIGGTFDEGAL